MNEATMIVKGLLWTRFAAAALSSGPVGTRNAGQMADAMMVELGTRFPLLLEALASAPVHVDKPTL